jgi:hypothetical protein
MPKLTDQSYPALTIPLAVPLQNSVNNVTTLDVIGQKTDTEVGNSVYSLLYRLDVDHHAATNVYPSLAAGAQIISAAADWAYGISTDIVPAAGGIATDFRLRFLILEACSDDGVFQLELTYGNADIIFLTMRYAVIGGFFGNQILQMLSSVLIPGGSRVRGRLASSDGLANQCTQRLSIAYR